MESSTIEPALPGLESDIPQVGVTTGHAIPLTPQKRLMIFAGRSHPELAARIVPDTARLVHSLARDHSLGRGVRIRLFLLLAYLALTIDLVPDIVPVLGYADDAIVIGVVLRGVMRHVGPEVVRRHWPGSPEGVMVLARLCRLPELSDDQ